MNEKTLKENFDRWIKEIATQEYGNENISNILTATLKTIWGCK